MNLEFSQQVFEKYSDIKFYEDPSSEIRVVSCGHLEGRTETDGHDEAKSRSRNFAKVHNQNKIIHTGIN